MRTLSVPARRGLVTDGAVLARVVWASVTLLVVVLFAVGTPLTFHELHSVCSAAPCPNWKLTPAAMRELHQQGISLDLYAGTIVAIDLASALVWLSVSAIILWSASANRMALIAAIFLVLFRASTFGGIITALGTETNWQWPVRVLETLGQSSIILFFYLFPNGRFVPRWTRCAVLPGVLVYLPNLLLFEGIWPRAAWAPLVLILSFVAGLATLPVAQIYRYRHVSGPIERSQTRWVVFGLAIAVAGSVGITVLTVSGLIPAGAPLTNLLGDTAWYVILLPLPLTIGISILRYHLWDIDLVINRTLVYGALTGSVVGLYVLVVGGLGVLLQARGNLLLSLFGAGLIALLFQSLRERLQRGVNHLMYGERDDPYAIVSRLGRRLEETLSPQAVLPTIVETVAEALRLPYVAIALGADSHPTAVASHGEPSAALLDLPLLYQGAAVGRLLLAPRPGQGTFSPADRRLLGDLALQAGIAAHALLLTTDLQRSREHLVTAREEERRRLRRDLHDGLGPALASLTLKLDAARNLLHHDPAASDALLLELKRQVQDAITDIRRVVYALRPTSLDELGLASAIREQAQQYESNGLRITLDAPDDLPSLPAAVEVAAYRIVQEALTNVARHAHAHHCSVRLERGDTLSLEIVDDGCGLAGSRPGVGLSSMRERAEELSGSCSIEPGERGGTRVSARLPIHSTHLTVRSLNGERSDD